MATENTDPARDLVWPNIRNQNQNKAYQKCKTIQKPFKNLMLIWWDRYRAEQPLLSLANSTGGYRQLASCPMLGSLTQCIHMFPWPLPSQHTHVAGTGSCLPALGHQQPKSPLFPKKSIPNPPVLPVPSCQLSLCMLSSSWGAILGPWGHSRNNSVWAIATGSHHPLRMDQRWLGGRWWGQTSEDALSSHPSPLLLMYIHTCCSLHSLHHDQPYQLMGPRQLEGLGRGQDECHG